MKIQSYGVWLYAFLMLGGGLMGFIKAGSVISLAVSTPLSLWLMLCAYGMQKNCTASYSTTVGTLIILMAFFGYRYFTTDRFMPNGLMAIITILLFGYFYTYRKDAIVSDSAS